MFFRERLRAASTHIGMEMLATELRARASRLKDMASSSDDESVRSELLYLAGEYEIAANEDEAMKVGHVARTTFPI